MSAVSGMSGHEPGGALVAKRPRLRRIARTLSALRYAQNKQTKSPNLADGSTPQQSSGQASLPQAASIQIIKERTPAVRRGKEYSRFVYRCPEYFWPGLSHVGSVGAFVAA
jgi:hypothetical protein